MATLASFEDANRHLDETKIKFVDDTDAEDEATAAFDVIAARIGGLWPNHILLWSHSPDPETDEEQTPAVIRQIASLLMASYRYAKLYSEEELGENDYSARLEKRANALLDGLAAGTVTLWDVDYGSTTATTGKLERGDFWPDDTYTHELAEIERENAEAEPGLQPNRAFSMDMNL